MTEQMELVRDIARYSLRWILSMFIVGGFAILCYRAGEVHLYDDKSVCEGFYPAKTKYIEVVPYGGEQ